MASEIVIQPACIDIFILPIISLSAPKEKTLQLAAYPLFKIFFLLILRSVHHSACRNRNIPQADRPNPVPQVLIVDTIIPPHGGFGTMPSGTTGP